MTDLRSTILNEVRKVVVGQDDVVDAVILTASVGGHVLLEGPPGTAKTLLVNAVARAAGLQFGRIQFTPDMLPSDVTGTVTLQLNGATSELRFRAGPVFTNLLLADEINRTPPKTQSALLEAMQERQVTVDGTTHMLEDPFMVIATQNPIEQEGTYPLPEAQLDRFLVKVLVGYPSETAEVDMLMLDRSGTRSTTLDQIQQVASAADFAALRSLVDAAHVTRDLAAYVSAVVRATRSLPSVELGGSPRAAVHLLAASRGAAVLAGRDFVTPDDVAWVAPAVLRHRLILRPEAELEGFRTDDAVTAVLAQVPVPR
ncbi:MAG: MoxR family ATPase [Acidimicrobiia bacterium]